MEGTQMRGCNIGWDKQAHLHYVKNHLTVMCVLRNTKFWYGLINVSHYKFTSA